MIERDASTADAAAIRALFHRSFTATFGHLYAAADLAAFLDQSSLARWRDELDDPAIRIRVAEDDGALVAFAKTGPVSLPVTPDGAAAELRQLYVDAAYKGSGIARALTDWVIATAREGGARWLFLSVYIDNHRARRFYERYGFEDIGAYRFMVGSHADEDRLMRLAL